MIVSNTRFLQQLEVSRQQKLAQDIARGQAQISTNKRLLAPSDDPIAANRISEIGRQQGNEAVWSSNVATASALAARGDTTLTNATALLDRAKELMLTAVNGTVSPEDRKTIAIELRSIADELQSLSDSKDFRGGALFSDATPLKIPVGDGLSIAPVSSKQQVFGSVVTASGTQDIMSIVNDAADALELTDDAARAAAGKASLDAVDAASDHIVTEHAELGLRAQRLDELNDRLEDSGIKLDEERTNLEAPDLAAVIASIQQKQVSLQAAQAIYAKLHQQNLFDLLR